VERTTHSLLAPLPYEDWIETKTTLHLFTQIVGKLQLRYTRLRNHWWNVTFRPSARGIATHLMHVADTFFEVEFDFIEHCVIVRSNRPSKSQTVVLRDGLSIAEFYQSLFSLFRSMDLELSVLATPYGMNVTTPFSQDVQHHRYDPVLVQHWWNAVLWSADVLNQFGTEFVGKQSEPQLFWHGFDLAVGRFSGRRSHVPPPDDPVAKEAYSDEVIAFGFWAGDANIPEPSYYTYTAPEPAAITSFPLRPGAALWTKSGSGHLGILPYDAVREATDPRSTLLDFFASAFEAGTGAAQWDTADLTRGLHRT